VRDTTFGARGKNIKFGALMVLRERPLVLLVRIGGKRSREFEGEGNEVMGVGLCEHTAQERNRAF
jgi:hypothetical protein